MAQVLVTGANGFLGSWLVRKLNEQGHRVRILCRPTSDLSELSGCDFEKCFGDVTNPDCLPEALKSVEVVFHLAGVIAYKTSERPLMEKVNVEGTRNLLDASSKSSLSRFIHLSSVVAVGASELPTVLDESSPYTLSKLNLGYFETKRAAENLVMNYFKNQKVDAVCLNPSTIYGPGDARKGSRKTQLQVARGKFPFYTSGGVSIVSVDNCVDGILQGWKKGRSGERYILAGENISIQKLFQLIAHAAGVEPPRTRIPNWALHSLGWIGDRMNSLGLKGSLSRENAWTASLYHWFDSSKAQRELNFKIQPAAGAIENSVHWIREQGWLDQQ